MSSMTSPFKPVLPTKGPVEKSISYAGLQTVNKQLESVYINLADVQGTQLNAVTKQTNIKKMIDDENSRLSAKQNTIDQAVQNQQRVIYFNDNNRKISSGYLNVLITIAITLGMVFLVRVLFFHFTKLPDALFNILIVIIISLGIIVSFNYYRGIIARNPYNYDELNLKIPHMDLSKSGADGNLGNLGSPTGCIGSQCCTPPTDEAPGTKWNDNQGKCIFAQAGTNISVITTMPVNTTPSILMPAIASSTPASSTPASSTMPIKTTIPEKFSLMAEKQTASYSPEPSYASV